MSPSAALQRQTFRKSERLCSRKIIENLVTKGRNISIKPFRLIWLSTELTQDVYAQVAFTVPKRNFKSAVKRNLLKRLMREAYRKNKSKLNALISKSELRLALLFVFTGNELISYQETEQKTISILKILEEDIKKHIR